jgi:HEXXH motif-containing protein
MTFDNLRIVMDDEPTFAQLSGYSHPYGPLDVAFLESTSVKMARHITGSFLSRYSGMLAARGSSDLAGVLEGWLSQSTVHETIWDDAFGQARACLTGPLGDRLVLEAAAGLGSRLCATGVSARFGVTLERASRLTFASWLLPAAAKLQFESDGNEVSIELSGGGTDAALRLRRDGARWELASGDATAIVEVERGGGRVQLLQRDALFPLAMGDLEPMIAEVVSADVSSSIEEAFGILRDHAPRYADWVSRQARRIVPLASPPGLMMSSSSIYRPGTITMSHNAHPLGMAEILVHENTHEYLHLASSCGPVDDGSDTKLYFSPIRGVDRPISAILVAYHAVGNIALFYRECRRTNAPGKEYLDVSEPEAIAWLAELDGPLARTSSLTEVGRALYEPLRDQLR